ncbi:MAG: DNA-binding protein WhiA [Blautia sp.]|nr:DNA-binding protein WhiA [Blautia sp.]
MSFSGMVKEELAGKTGAARHCMLAELAAIMESCGHLEQGEGRGPVLRVYSENETNVRKCFTLLEKAFNIDTAVLNRDAVRPKRGQVYLIELDDPTLTEEILGGTKLVEDRENGGLKLMQNAVLTQRECCKRAYLRGAFLASGSISDPNKGYHFEIVCQDGERAGRLKSLIRSFHIDAKTVLRKKSHVVYVKEGAQIVDMLALMGAGIALMDLENVRILKEMRNSVNRKVNCETANINKTVLAAVRQMEDIRLIERTAGFQSLSDELAEAAALRLQYPDATLKELGEMMDPPIGKSGINHRFRKLSAIADKLRGNEEELL